MTSKAQSRSDSRTQNSSERDTSHEMITTASRHCGRRLARCGWRKITCRSTSADDAHGKATERSWLVPLHACRGRPPLSLTSETIRGKGTARTHRLLSSPQHATQRTPDVWRPGGRWRGARREAGSSAAQEPQLDQPKVVSESRDRPHLRVSPLAFSHAAAGLLHTLAGPANSRLGRSGPTHHRHRSRHLSRAPAACIDP